jgi:hypothetical protein
MGRRSAGIGFALLLSILYALPNAAKPLHIDDTATWIFARQIAAHPLDPYGFRMLWVERPEPAQEILHPLVLAYWLSPALRLVGERPFLWKLWLLPPCMALGAALFAILRRASPGCERPLLAFTLFSPALLPSLNLMLDVPALALVLLALAVFALGTDRVEGTAGRWPNRRAQAALATLAAGALLALGAQTKYTGLVMVAVVAAYGVVVARRRLLGVAAALIAAALFAAWEVYVAVQYGDSHFLLHLASHSPSWADKLALVPSLVGAFGTIAPGLGLLILLSLGASRRTLAAAGVAGAAALAAIALCPESIAVWRQTGDPSGEAFALTFVVFLTLGIAVLVGLGAVSWRLLTTTATRLDVFLVAWLALEAAGCLLLSPFPAARRVLGLFVVGTIVAGRLASRNTGPDGARRMRGVLAFNAALAAVFFYVDLREARAQRDGVEEASHWIAAQAADVAAPRVWYTGHWGVQYYAERAGMTAAYHGGVDGSPRLHAGDWLVVPFARVAQQAIRIEPGAATAAHVVQVGDAIPLRTVMSYYMGRTGIDRLEGPRFQATVYRVTKDFEP